MAVEVGLVAVVEQIGKAIESNNWQLTDRLLWPALDQFNHVPQLWYHAGNHLFTLDKVSLAALCFEKAIALEPNAIAMANLGAAYRRLNRPSEALQILTQSSELEPDSKSCWTNLAACFINEGAPEIGLKYANKALAIDPDFNRGQWNAALCHLELGNFRKGFEFYESGMAHDRILRTYGKAEYLTDARHQLAKGKGKKLIVYGEQGIGDELMFTSIIYDAKKDYEIVLDCHPRLVWFFRQAFPYLEIHPTRKTDDDKIEWNTKADFAIAQGDLGKWYRPSRASFTRAWKAHAPFYQYPQEERDRYRVGLEAIAEGRRIIGLTTRGGVIKTARYYRTIDIKNLAPLLSDDRYFFVCVDYEQTDDMCEQIEKDFGPDKIRRFDAVSRHFDYFHQAAIVGATEVLVTICQSVFHLSAAMNHPTLCLVPKRPAWRYGLKSTRAFWYPGKNIRLFRAVDDGNWTKPVKQVQRHLELFFGGKGNDNV